MNPHLSCHGPVRRRVFRNHPVKRELRFNPGAAAIAVRLRGLWGFDQRPKCSRQRGGITGRHKHSTIGRYDFRRAADPGGHNRQPCSHGLQDRQRDSLAERRVHVGVAAGQPAPCIFAVTEKVDARLNAEFRGERSQARTFGAIANDDRGNVQARRRAATALSSMPMSLTGSSRATVPTRNVTGAMPSDARTAVRSSCEAGDPRRCRCAGRRHSLRGILP